MGVLEHDGMQKKLFPKDGVRRIVVDWYVKQNSDKQCFFIGEPIEIMTEDSSAEYPSDFYMSRILRKTTFYICKNKGADQLHSNRAADQRLCFRFIDSTIPLLP